MSSREISRTPFAGAYYIGQFGDNNADGACLWCGRQLRVKVHPAIQEKFPLRGDYRDGAFCGLRCGYAFGIAAAIAGHRFTAKP